MSLRLERVELSWRVLRVATFTNHEFPILRSAFTTSEEVAGQGVGFAPLSGPIIRKIEDRKAS
jgi:hypothetical protein